MKAEINVMKTGACLGSGVVPVKSAVAWIPGLTKEQIEARFEAAGAALLALPGRGYSTKMRMTRFDVIQDTLDAYGWQGVTVRPPMPNAAAISEMDEVFGWLRHIPEHKHVLRRIVGARALVHPVTLRHLLPWRRLGQMLGADHKSVQRWHGQAIEMILVALRGG